MKIKEKRKEMRKEIKLFLLFDLNGNLRKYKKK